MSKCNNLSIVLVTEKTKGSFQPSKLFVECEDCGEVLPILSVTQEERIVPIFNN